MGCNRLINKESVHMMCIQETKKETIDKSLCQALWGSVDVMWEMQPANNSADGILCMWTETEFKLQNKITGNGFIYLEGEFIREAQKVCIVTIYSPCDIHNKRILWEIVRQLKQSSQVGLWCVLGDFNCIRNPTERFGKCERLYGDNSMQEFNEWIDDLEVLEVPSMGRQFTWFRPNGESRSRLDRFLISPEWRDRWPESVQFTLPRNFSNHCPILLRPKDVDWGPKPFRTLNCWLTDKSFKEVVQQCWDSVQVSGWGAYVLKEKFKRLKHTIKRWNKEQYGDNFKKVQNLEVELNKLEEDTMNRQLTDQEVCKRKQLQESLWIAAQAHESLLRQKSRSRWIKEGDCNTRYFHIRMNANRNRNCIKGIFIDGVWTDDPHKVKEEIRNFFSKRFQESDAQRPNIDGISFRTIDQQQNSLLVAPFQEIEIQNAVGECGSDKSLGLDGFNFRFIKQFWDILKPDILCYIHEFHANGAIPRGCNASFVALIPKISEPQHLCEYRPISLIGCMYKIVAKLLANRIRKVMPAIIDETQFAFIEGRHLLQSVLIANEVIDEARRSHNPCLIFKVDFEKAYDSVSWEFLLYMLKRLGFNSQWIKWIEGCIKSASMLVLVNESPTDEFLPQRGIRQGDPLAPFLFNVVAEALSGLLRRAIAENLYKGYSVGSKNVNISILQYADDTIFFGKASMENVRALKATLRAFELISGLKINYAKSCFGAFGVTDQWKLFF